MTDTVTEEIIPARTVVYLRGTIDNYAAEGQLWSGCFLRFSSKASLPSARAAPLSTTTSTRVRRRRVRVRGSGRRHPGRGAARGAEHGGAA